MILTLVIIFAMVAIAGFTTGHAGIGLIAIGMAIFTYYGGSYLDKLDADWANDPRRIKAEEDALYMLDQHASESSKDRI